MKKKIVFIVVYCLFCISVSQKTLVAQDVAEEAPKQFFMARVNSNMPCGAIETKNISHPAAAFSRSNAFTLKEHPEYINSQTDAFRPAFMQETQIFTPFDRVSIPLILAEHYFNDSFKWIASQQIQKRGIFSGLWKSYRFNTRHKYPEELRYLVDFQRTWTYDDALGVYAELKRAKRYELEGNRALYAEAMGNAVRGIEGLFRLAKWEEEENSFDGLWHFSYNTNSDSFIDPRGPIGANLWALNAILSYTIQTGDTKYLEWVRTKIQTFLFQQQVTDKNDPRYGLIQAGLLNATDYAYGNMMGYSIREGNTNVQNQNCHIEHNADYIATLRLAAIAERRFNKYPDQRYLSELRRRHEICIKAVISKFWRGDHFCTALDAHVLPDGTLTAVLNESVAVDNNSWVGDVIMSYDMELAWKCLQYNKKNFMRKARVNIQDRKENWHEVEVEGLFFFDKDFIDPYVCGLTSQERDVFERMIQPEATFGYITLLIKYAQLTDYKDRREECLSLIKRLYESMVIIKLAYVGDGTPYATEFISQYFNTAESMAGTATGAITTCALFGVSLDDFVGATPPSDFLVDGKAPLFGVDIDSL